MENNLNNPQPGGGQPVEPTTPLLPNPPQPSEPDKPQGKAKWVTILSLAIIVVALYTTGFWQWLGNQLTGTPQTDTLSDVEETVLPETGDTEDATKNDQDKINGKARVSFVISSGLSDGTVLVSGASQPNVEIRKVFVHNPFKDSWVLVYDGFRPLDLMQLAAVGERHELIEIGLTPLFYDSVRIEFVDLLTVDEKSGQRVARTRTVDMAGAEVVADQDNVINIRFNMNDPSLPLPQVTR